MKKYLFIALLISLINGAFSQSNTDEDLANQFFQSNDFEKASELYLKLYEKQKLILYYDAYFNCLKELKDFIELKKFLKKQMKQNPYNPRFAVDAGYVLQMENDSNKAKQQYEQVIKKLIVNDISVIDVANAFALRNLYNYSIIVLKKGQKEYGNTEEFSTGLADIYEKIGDYEAMMNEIISYIEIDYTYYENAQSVLQIAISEDVDGLKTQALKNVLLRKNQKNPNNELYSKFLLWLSIQMKDFETAFLQAKAIDKRQKGDGDEVFELAKICVSNQTYDIAIKAYEYIVSKGENNNNYFNSRIELAKVKYLQLSSSFKPSLQDFSTLETQYNEIISELGESNITVPLLLDLAHIKAFYLNNTTEAIEILKKTIALPGISIKLQADCKVELADIYILTNDVWEATLLYSQVEKAFKQDPIGHNAKLKNAKLSFYIGEFEWAKAQLDVLKAATSKLIANDAMEFYLLISDNIDVDSSYVPLTFYAKADLLYLQHKYNESIATLDSILEEFPRHPIVDEAILKKANIYKTLGTFDKVDTLLKLIVANYSYDILADDALFQLAELYELQFNNKVKAMEYYQDLLVNYPGSLYTVEARKRFRILRGDRIN